MRNNTTAANSTPSVDDNCPLIPNQCALTLEPHNPDFESGPAAKPSTSSKSQTTLDYSSAHLFILELCKPNLLKLGGGDFFLTASVCMFSKVYKLFLCAFVCAWPGTGQ